MKSLVQFEIANMFLAFQHFLEDQGINRATIELTQDTPWSITIHTPRQLTGLELQEIEQRIQPEHSKVVVCKLPWWRNWFNPFQHINHGIQPPQHYNCRSVTVPLEKDIEVGELRFHTGDTTISIKLDGTFWLNGTVLGKDRDIYNAFKELASGVEQKFRKAIEHHREQTGHNMCWENDNELWAVLDDGVKVDHTAPSWPDFMTRCVMYRASKDGLERGQGGCWIKKWDGKQS